MRLYEGNILTCDKENRIAHYLLEDQGKILYCGDELPAGCVAAERVSTGEGALIPRLWTVISISQVTRRFMPGSMS